jgi:hypothetical protein
MIHNRENSLCSCELRTLYNNFTTLVEKDERELQIMFQVNVFGVMRNIL